ncbi:type I-E CRISPR-associated protein Cas5/CasD [Rothia mucilaginosa]|uniref:Type I-E CRISPR-associated protein Cas5/CasD n=1 Tax=Rothia mucilaginosa TaxID=43675 RepID=A0A943TBC6_9MICC|nr:type I-E CRISPR-associated protein Cas5/CasD [Rothia mucilaginosa]MBS6634515.1 type I-E CRISPR-associated protein Cas5/CasD [Rothia mucilaginosa]
MPTLLLKMSGPLQSWGTQSRFRRRDAGHEPSKSGVIGMVAAALGRSRNEPVDDLVSLKFAVRTDASGTLIRDYQTAKNWAKNPMGTVSLSTRMYLSDAVFVVALEGEREQLETIESALKKPVYPLYLGRRACPAGYDLVLGIRDESAEGALRSLDWQVPEYRRKDFPSPVALRILRDALPGERGDLVQDVPVSFSPEYRQYVAREVVTVEPLVLENLQGRKLRVTESSADEESSESPAEPDFLNVVVEA